MPLILPSGYPGAPAYLYNGHLQTIVPSLLRRVTGVDYQRERLTLSDGDFVDLDWVRRGNDKLVVITHGLEGDSRRQYVMGAAKLFSENGYDVLAWNCRSCSGEMNRAFRLYNHGEIGDIHEVLHHALQAHPYTDVTLLGFSMGGNIILKYLGVYGAAVSGVIRRGIAVSAPTDLHASAQLLDHPSNRFYRNRFMKKLLVKVACKAAQFPGRLDMANARRVRVWRDFDTFFSAPINGYRDADDFYTQASAINFMPAITVPVLLMNAQNDPMLSPECSPVTMARTNPNIYLETPATGGHVGFMTARDPYTYAERRALAFAQTTTPFQSPEN